MQFNFLNEFQPLNRKNVFSPAIRTAIVVLSLALLAASCASSTSEPRQTATESPPAPTEAPPPPETTEATTPETAAAPPPAEPTAAAPDTGAAVARCLEEFAEVAGEVPEEAKEEAALAWEQSCNEFINAFLDVAQSARQMGGDSACVERVLGEVLAAPFAAFNSYAESADNTPQDAPAWGQFEECMS